LPTLLDAKKEVLSRSLSRDSINLSVVVEFVMVGSVTCMPAHRVFRHTWRDSKTSLQMPQSQSILMPVGQADHGSRRSEKGQSYRSSTVQISMLQDSGGIRTLPPKFPAVSTTTQMQEMNIHDPPPAHFMKSCCIQKSVSNHQRSPWVVQMRSSYLCFPQDLAIVALPMCHRLA
jgi:hypothetical protein